MSRPNLSLVGSTSPESLPRHQPNDGSSLRHGNGGGGGGGMLERVKKLEDQMLGLVTDVAVIKSNYATKADLHKEIGKQTKWIAATIIATAVLCMGAAKLIF